MKTSQRKVLLASGKYHFDPNTSGLTWQNGAGQCYNTVLFLGVYSFSVVGKGILKNQKDDIEQKSSTYFSHQGFAILSDTVLKSLFIVFIVFLESLDLLLLKKKQNNNPLLWLYYTQTEKPNEIHTSSVYSLMQCFYI